MNTTLSQQVQSVEAWLWGRKSAAEPQRQHRHNNKRKCLGRTEQRKNRELLVYVSVYPRDGYLKYQFTITNGGPPVTRKGAISPRFRFAGAYRKGTREAKRWASKNLPGLKLKFQRPRLVKAVENQRRGLRQEQQIVGLDMSQQILEQDLIDLATGPPRCPRCGRWLEVRFDAIVSVVAAGSRSGMYLQTDSGG